MADNTIDTLELKISSDSRNASQGIERLASSLLGLSKSTGRSVSGLSKFSQELNNLVNSINKIPSLQKLNNFITTLNNFSSSGEQSLTGFNNFINSIERLNSIDLDNAKINKISRSLKNIIGTDTSKFNSSSFSQMMTALEGIKNIPAVPDSINQIISSLRGLASINTGGFEPTKLNQIITALKDFNKIPDISNSINRFVSSLARLASSGEKSEIVVQQLPQLGQALRNVIEKMSGLENISDSTNTFVQSIARLASAGKKAGETANGLDTLAEKTLSFFDAMKNAPNISENTIRMLEALSKLTGVGGHAGSAANKLNAHITKLSGSMFGLHGSTKKAIAGIKSFSQQLLSAMGIYASIYGAIQGIKKSIDISSKLTEIQNVVDVTFGDMKQKVEDLASTSIQDFGMSELTTKQISSRFQAMGVAMGFTEDKMSDMSIRLTELTADMASFYDISQEKVAEKLGAIFTGQTRPLILAA